MAIGTDFEIQADKDIRYIGAAHGASGAGYYTVLELHEWARGLGDDASATGDDNYDITVVDLSDKAFDTIIELKMALTSTRMQRSIYTAVQSFKLTAMIFGTVFKLLPQLELICRLYKTMLF
jgi:hypothetical protein